MNNNLIQGLITFYINQYKDKHGEKPIVNRNKVKFLIAEILQDLSKEEVEALILFYLKVESQPNLERMCYEYDELLKQKDIEEEDILTRKALMRETHQKVIDFRERYRK